MPDEAGMDSAPQPNIVAQVEVLRNETLLTPEATEGIRQNAVRVVNALNSDENTAEDFKAALTQLFESCGLRNPTDFAEGSVQSWDDRFTAYTDVRRLGAGSFIIDLEAKDKDGNYGNFYIHRHTFTGRDGKSHHITKVMPGACSTKNPIAGDVPSPTDVFYLTAEKALGIRNFDIARKFGRMRPGLRQPPWIARQFYVVGDKYYRVPVTKSIGTMLDNALK